MKKILFVTSSLKNRGGIIRSLQNFMFNIPENKYEIYVLPTSYSSKDNVELQNCQVLDYDLMLASIFSIYSDTADYRYRKFVLAVKVILNLLSKFHIRSSFENVLFRFIARKYQDYDLVISFEEGIVTRFVSYIKCRKKVAWIHSDYKEYHYNRNKINELGIYSKFDVINSVSKYTRSNFDLIYPSLKNKSDFVYNFLDTNFIIKEAGEVFPDLITDKSKYIFISVGRVSPVKQFSQIPSIINKMLESGHSNFKWLVMGGVDDNAEFKKMMSELEKYNITKDNFEYIGNKMNPYPYIKNADLLISVSKSEACPFVVNEAKVLNVPVVSNNYPSIYEFIENEKNGFITTLNEMPVVLTRLISNKDEMRKIKDNTLKHPYSNKMIIEKFYKILDM